VPKTTTRNTGKLVIPLVVLVAAVFLLRPDTGEGTKLIFVTNSLPGVTLDRILLDNETVNLLESNLYPGETVLLSIPETGSELTASDADGGMYLFAAASADSADTLRVQISITNRDTFEHIMESDGELYAGSGESTVRITNGLEWHNIHTITVTCEGGDPVNIPNILDTFVLPPGKTLNTRVSRGSYTVNATDDMGNHYSCRVSLTQPDQAAAACSITGNCLLYTMKSSGTGSSRLILCNALGDWIITGLYHRNSGAETWSENHLLTSGIEPKELFSLLLDPGTYDVKVVDEDNDSYTRYGIEVSDAGTSWSVSMSDLDRFIP
jgi:hypothetical protein